MLLVCLRRALAVCATLLPIVAQAAECDPKVKSPPGHQGAGWTVWGGDLQNSRYRASRVAARPPVPRLLWAFSLGESVNARSQPAVAGGRVFVGSEQGRVWAIDAATGCSWWMARTDLPVRSAIVVDTAANGDAATLYFGDLAGAVYALDATTGARKWKTKVDPHFAAIVTGAPQVYRGVLYVPVSSYESALPAQPTYSCCTFRGSVVALDAATGRVIWQTHTIADSARPAGNSIGGTGHKGPSGAAVWSTPTIDERLGRLYVGTGNNYSDPPTSTSDAIHALELATGRIVWARQYAPRDAYNVSCDIPGKANCPKSDGPDADFGQPPMLVTLRTGRRALVVGQKSGEVHALDPDAEGAPLWTTRVGPGGRLGGVHWGSATDGQLAYVALGGQGIRALPDSTLKEGFRLEPDPKQGGGLFALDVATGRIVWRAKPFPCGERPRCSPAQSAPVTAMPGLVLSGALDGHLRAYASKTGVVLWDVDTAREYTAVNGLPARGGSIDAAGAVVSGGLLLATSGYSLYGGMPGNVLLAFDLNPSTRRALPARAARNSSPSR